MSCHAFDRAARAKAACHLFSVSPAICRRKPGEPRGRPSFSFAMLPGKHKGDWPPPQCSHCPQSTDMELMVDWTSRASWKCWACNDALAWDVYTQNMYAIRTPPSPGPASPAGDCSAKARATVLCGPPGSSIDGAKTYGKSTSASSAMPSPAADPRQDALALLAHALLESGPPPSRPASTAQIAYIQGLCLRLGYEWTQLIAPEATMTEASAVLKLLLLVQ